MGNQRAGLDLDNIDIEELAGKGRGTHKPSVDPARIQEVAEQSGFISRQPQKKRRQRKKSPYTEQLCVRVRPGMKGLFQDMADLMDTRDHTAFERALLALIEKNGTAELMQQYK